MNVIGFFRVFFENISQLVNFVTTPLGELNEAITFEPLKSLSVMGLFGASLGLFLAILLGFHILRLFIGG